MAQATDDDTTIHLWKLFTDPRVREAFRRAERDHGAAISFRPSYRQT